MGQFWRRNDVTWRGNRRIGPAALLGVRAGAKRTGRVDFWRQVGIYALYAVYHLVYVGQAGLGDQACIGTRLKQHTKNDLAGRWDMFSWFGLCKVNSNLTLGARFKIGRTTWRGVADILEGVLIEVAEPPMNSQRGRFGSGVHRYLQVPARDVAGRVPDEQQIQASRLARIEKVLARLAKRL